MLSIILIGVSLSMDAFAISVANGLTLKSFNWKHALWMGIYFGGFQFLMPLLGYFLAGTVSGQISALGPYISFFLLAGIGGKMIWDAFHEDEDDTGMDALSHKQLLLMAIATSIDALAVGVSFAFMESIRIIPSCAIIGATTFTISFLGAFLGGRLPRFSGKRAGILGGVVLIGIGVKILLEGILG